MRTKGQQKEQRKGTPNWANRTIWTGDNLDVMRGMNSGSVDLIYLDPPFNSNANYAAPIGSRAAGAAFKDTWGLDDISLAWHGLIKYEHPGLYDLLNATRQVHSKSMMAYLIYMAVRVMEMHRVLKPDGSLWLHCDPHAGHYLKLLLDAIFGPKQRQACVTWRRTFAHNDKLFGAVSDYLLYYAKGDNPTRNAKAVKTEFSDKEVRKKYPDSDERGCYTRDNLMGPGTSAGESGQAWRGCDPTTYGRCWSAPKTGKYAEWLGRQIPGYLAIKGVHARLEALEKAGFIYWTRTGNPRLKRYAIPGQGRIPGDLWTDVPPLATKASERTKYPTQKPVALLRRVVQASSNEGDVVLDPFCGCATTCIAAEQLRRQWVGIDIAEKAADLVRDRMDREVGRVFEGAHRTDLPRRTDLGKVHRYNHPDNKRALYGAQGGYCNGCETHFEPRHFHVDHIIARDAGGTDHISNLQLLCGSCNSTKGTKSQEELIVALTEKGFVRRKKTAEPAH